ncbi:MAG: hypothetical protein NTZ05_17255 [Chloroflexi bacterium]|nr:hypothetical protein [Chloroflexota bacterium]
MAHRRWWFSLIAAVLFWVASALPLAGSAYADVEYCGDEPPVLVRTPAGNPVLVNNYLRVPFANRGALRLATVTGSAERGDRPGQSRIRLAIHVPGRGKHISEEDFEVAVKSVVQKYDVTKSEIGRSGSDIVVTLTVPVS